MTTSIAKPIPVGYAALVLLPVFLVVVIIAGGYGLSEQFGDQLTSTPFVLYLNTFSYLVGVGLVVVLLRRRGNRLADIGLSTPESIIEEIIWAIGFTVVGTFILWFIAQAIAQVLGLPESSAPPTWQTGLETWAVFIGPILMAAFLNEFLFRGLFITVLSIRINIWVAAICSALLFGLVQLLYSYEDGTLMIFYFLWSLMPAILFVLRRNLWGPFIVHFLNNWWGLIFVGLIFG